MIEKRITKILLNNDAIEYDIGDTYDKIKKEVRDCKKFDNPFNKKSPTIFNVSLSAGKLWPDSLI